MGLGARIHGNNKHLNETTSPAQLLVEKYIYIASAGPWSSMYLLPVLLYWLSGLPGCHYFNYLRTSYNNASQNGRNPNSRRKSREGTQNS